LVLFVGLSVGQTCNNSNTFDGACTSSSAPYCLETETGGFINPTITYQCVQCLSNCDCGLNSYCSSNPDTLGKCTKFDRYGDSCLPFDDNHLTNSNFTDKLKCAMLYQAEDGSLQIDQHGVCISGKCRYCSSYGNGGGLSSCSATDGTKEPRVCAYPGKQVSVHTSPWYPSIYWETPGNVWWGVMFVFYMILFFMQSATLFIKHRKSKNGSIKNENSSTPVTIQHRESKKPEEAPIQMQSYDQPPPKSGHSTQNSIHSSTNSNVGDSKHESYDMPPAKKEPPPYEETQE